MCPPPCGHRRSSRTSSRIELPKIETRITKKEVESIIYSGEYDCDFKMENSKVFEPYEGCTNNLMRILHDGSTRVKVAGRKSPYFMEGKRTVIMNAPEFAVLLLHTDLSADD